MAKATETYTVETAIAAPDAFDFASRDVAAKAEQGAEIEVLDPATGEAVGVYITLAGLIPASIARRPPTSPSAVSTIRKASATRALILKKWKPKASKYSPRARSAGRVLSLTACPCHAAGTTRSGCTPAFPSCVSRSSSLSATARNTCRTRCIVPK